MSFGVDLSGEYGYAALAEIERRNTVNENKPKYLIETVCTVSEVITNDHRTQFIPRQSVTRSWEKDSFEDATAYHDKLTETIDSLGLKNDSQSLGRRAA